VTARHIDRETVEPAEVTPVGLVVIVDIVPRGTGAGNPLHRVPLTHIEGYKQIRWQTTQQVIY